jgi:energy-coupling factor transporter transmembrane protein EcfT
MNENEIIDSRVRVLALVLLSIAHGIASSQFIPALFLLTVIIAWLYKDSFVRGITIIGISAAAIAIFAFVVWIITINVSLAEFLIGYFRWLSLITLSVVLFLSLDTLQLVVDLVRFKLPVKIAIALGVGLRFIPILFEETRRVLMIQRRRGISFSQQGFRRHHFINLLNRISSPILISVLRRVDSLTLSIGVQQLEYRIKQYQLPNWRIRDWMALLIIAAFFIMAVLSYFQK